MTLKEIRSLDAGSKFSGEYQGERVPLFEEFLELTRKYPDMTYDFELKEYPTEGNESRAYETADRVISLIEEYGLGDKCVLNAFSAVLLQYIHDKYEGRYKLHGYYPKSLLGCIGKRGHPYDYFILRLCLRRISTRENFGRLKAKGIDTWAGTRFKKQGDGRAGPQLRRYFDYLRQSAGGHGDPAGDGTGINSDIKQNNLSGSR